MFFNLKYCIPSTIRIAVFFCIFCVSRFCIANEINIIYGAGLHLGQGKHEASIATASLRVLGLDGFRDEIYWHRFEDVEGKFRIDLIPPELRKALEHPWLAPRSMIILGYGNSRYDSGGRPRTDFGRAAFARYAREVARTYPQIGYFEIWNEWNHAIGVRDGSKGTADDYMKLVVETSSALRSGGTKAKIIVGGLADDLPDWPFARELVDKGVLKYADAFSVHLYNYSAGDRAVPQEMFDRLKRLQEILRSGNGGKDFPIMITEMGWPTHEGRLSTSETQAGAFISQFLLEAATYSWIKGIWIYELFNSGTVKTDREHNFGILKNDGAAKTGTCIIRESLGLLQDARYLGRGVTAGKAHWVQFQSGSKSFFVVYSPYRSSEVEFSLAAKFLNSTRNICGVTPSVDLASQPTWVPIKVSNTPVVIWNDSTSTQASHVLR